MACIGKQKRRANDDPYGVGEQSGKRVRSPQALERALPRSRYRSTPSGHTAIPAHIAPSLLPFPPCPKHGAARACTSMYLLPPLTSYPLPVSLPPRFVPPSAPYVKYTVLYYLFGLVRKSFHCLHLQDQLAVSVSSIISMPNTGMATILGSNSGKGALGTTHLSSQMDVDHHGDTEMQTAAAEPVSDSVSIRTIIDRPSNGVHTS